MAKTYATMFPVDAKDHFIADQLNFIGEINRAISARATLSGATVTLPAVMADGEPVDNDDELFHDWLDAARTAYETILARTFFRELAGSAVWADIGAVLTYVHTKWPTATFQTSGQAVDAWMPYVHDSPKTNRYRIGYLNELYYVGECLCFYELSCTRDAADLSSKSGLGGVAHTNYSDWDHTTVDGETQTGTTDHTPVGPIDIYLGEGMGVFSQYHANEGDSEFTLVSGQPVTASSIDHATGEWSITTGGYSWTAGRGINEDYWAGGTVTKADAFDLGYDAFEAAGYAGSSGVHLARIHSHLFQFSAAWFYDVSDQKVSGGHIGVPNEPFALSQLFVPFHQEKYATGGPLNVAVACPEGTGVTPRGAWDGTAWVGFMQIDGDFDNETVHLNYNFAPVDRDNWGSAVAAHEWTQDAYVEDPAMGGVFYGRSGFGGYCNKVYDPYS